MAALILHALGKDVQTPGGTPPCTTTACSTDPVQTTPTTTGSKGGLASIGYPGGGCSSTGMQSLWLAVPVFALFAFRRRRTA